METPAESERLEALPLGTRITQLHLKLGLPVPHMTRKRLREAHPRVYDLFRKMDGFYQGERRRQRWGNLAALVYVLVELCQDGVLCDKLMNAGFLSRVVDMTNAVDYKSRPLELLSLVARRGSKSTRANLCREVPALMRVFQRLLDASLPEAGPITATLAHCAETAVLPLSSDLVSALMQADISNMVLTSTFKKPGAPLDVVLHSLAVASLVQYFTVEEAMHISRTLSLFAALSKSKDIGLRAVALQVFRNVRTRDTSTRPFYVPPPDLIDRDMSLSCFTPELQKLFVDYGYDRCTLPLSGVATERFRNVVDDFERHEDLYRFAAEMAAIFQNTSTTFNERPVAIPGCPTVDWSAYLPICMKFLRERAAPGDADVANILEMEFLRMKRSDGVLDAARRAIAQNPQSPHGYYIYCDEMSWREEDGPDMALRGLACPNVSLPIRWQLLAFAVDSLSTKGWKMIFGADNTDEARRAYGVECVQKATEYAQTYMKEAPPDGQSRLEVLNTYFFDVLLLHGHELKKDAAIFQSHMEDIKRTERLFDYLGCHVYDPPKQPRIGRELLESHYKKSPEARWGPVVDHIDSLMSSLHSRARRRAGPVPDKITDPSAKYAGWATLSMDVLAVTSRGPLKCGCDDGIETEYPANIRLYPCSLASCRRRTALLRKCGGCHGVVYCDDNCQQADWERHRADCSLLGGA